MEKLKAVRDEKSDLSEKALKKTEALRNVPDNFVEFILKIPNPHNHVWNLFLNFESDLETKVAKSQLQPNFGQGGQSLGRKQFYNQKRSVNQILYALTELLQNFHTVR